MKEVKKIFYKAISNDIYFDVKVNERLDTKGIFGLEFFRPAKLSQLLKKYPVLILCLRFLHVLWMPIGLVYLLFCFIKSILKVRFKTFFLNYDTIFLSFSTRLQVLKDDVKNENEQQIVIYLNKKSIPLKADDQNISIFELASLADCFKSLFLAIIVHLEMCFGNKYKGYKKLFSLFSFEWFLTYNVLNKQRVRKVYFANHYDRWAILFDAINFPEASLIQHGLLSDNITPPYKLQNITEVLCFNSSQIEIFKKIVVVSNPHFIISSKKLNLTDLNKDNPTLLIISCLPLTYTNDKLLLERLSGRKYEIYLKPHPVYSVKPYSELRKNIDFHLIREKDFFPKVNVVVSYNSTLGYEYEMCGIRVLYLNNSSDLDNVVNML